jgi:hypothetical protein
MSWRLCFTETSVHKELRLTIFGATESHLLGDDSDLDTLGDQIQDKVLEVQERYMGSASGHFVGLM